VWAVTRAAADPARAADWIRFVLSREEIAAMTDANAAVPARPRVAETSALYGPDGPLRPLLDALEGGWAVPRPRTPVYPFATSAFQDLMEDVRNGEDVAAAARAAARLVDREIEDNRGYPPVAVTP
jgi:multiple sugar transport system substrate-binding protein